MADRFLTTVDVPEVSAASAPAAGFMRFYGKPDGYLYSMNSSGVERRLPAVSNITGVWGYASGTSGTETLTGDKRVLKITAVALEAAGTIQINGGDVIPLPYGSTDSVSTELTIEPSGNLTNPTIIFSNTDSYFVEYVT